MEKNTHIICLNPLQKSKKYNNIRDVSRGQTMEHKRPCLMNDFYRQGSITKKHLTKEDIKKIN